jgi:hypothetical protein
MIAAAFAVLAALQASKVEVPGTPVVVELVPVEGAGLKPVRLATKETTWTEFNAFFETKDAGADATTRPTRATAYFGQVGVPASFLEHAKPVVNLRWHSAVAYCDWLSKKTGAYFRLPTEPEWEAAAKTGGVSDEQAWHKGNSGERTHVGGEKKANGAGAFDMFGNLWEYVLEFHDGSAYAPVVKGGCWNTPAAEMKPELRHGIPQAWFDEDPNRPRSVWWLTNKDQSQGIRVACAADASDKDARLAAAAKVEVKVLKFTEKTIKVDKSSSDFAELEVEVKNGSDKVLDEVEVLLYYLDPKGKPHLADLAGVNKPGQATFTKAWPVLANARVEAARAPLKPGETRAFKADVPQTYDGDDDVDREKFGGKATNVRLAK